MIITIAHYKGGVGKTTTAYHFAAYFQIQAPTLLIDNDPGRSALRWAQRGGDQIQFKVVSQAQGAMYAGRYTHIINDTKAREDMTDLPEIVEGCNLLVLPVEPGTMEYEQTLDMVSLLRQANVSTDKYRVLITKWPPFPERDGFDLFDALSGEGVPLFQNHIRAFKVYKKAVSFGLPVYALKEPKAHEAWNDYLNACQEIHV